MAKFIAIEGPDGAGKTTTCDALEIMLKLKGYTVERIKFPRKDSQFGKLIYEMLQSDEVNNSEKLRKTMHELYVLDRQDYFQKNLVRLESEVDVVLMDRSYYSNIVYQIVSGLNHNINLEVILKIISDTIQNDIIGSGIENIDISVIELHHATISTNINALHDRAVNNLEKLDLFEKGNNATAANYMASGMAIVGAMAVYSGTKFEKFVVPKSIYVTELNQLSYLYSFKNVDDIALEIITASAL